MGQHTPGLVAVITQHKEGLRLTVRSAATRKRVAVVEGSEGFLRRALDAIGLSVAAPTAVARLSEDGDGAGFPLVRSKPANGHL